MFTSGTDNMLIIKYDGTPRTRQYDLVHLHVVILGGARDRLLGGLGEFCFQEVAAFYAPPPQTRGRQSGGVTSGD